MKSTQDEQLAAAIAKAWLQLPQETRAKGWAEWLEANGDGADEGERRRAEQGAHVRRERVHVLLEESRRVVPAVRGGGGHKHLQGGA